MRVRAAIFDVYGTLLEVGPPPGDADERWKALFRDTFKSEPALSRLDFSIATNRAIAMRHAEAKARGIQFPEIVWPCIVAEVLSGFSRLSPSLQDEFIFRQIQIGRTTQLKTGVGYVMQLLLNRGCVLGIASNAQHYTIRELQEALAGNGAHFNQFESSLCVWSFENGFSKPDPHVFQIVSARLEARGISTAETLVIGDRLDNEIEPARAYGMQTWHLTTYPSPAPKSGSWEALANQLQHGW
ncbi:MAG TPA: HAD family hydrolase [Verrucomicrobiae bacterium]|nr:HAD family hydrolase [Verrucomicrobiae bacterium]